MKSLVDYAALFTEHTLRLARNVNVYYREANPNGRRTIIVVHGITGTHYSMLQAAGVWAEAGDHVIAIDLPGHGKSDPIAIRSFHDLADWLHEVIEKVYPEGDYILMGNSFGSNVCAGYASIYGLRGGSSMVLGAPIPSINRVLRSIERLTATLPNRLTLRIYYANRAVEPLRMMVLLGQQKNQEARKMLRESIRSEGPLVRHRYAFGHLMPHYYAYDPYSRELPDDVACRTIAVIGEKDRVAGRTSIRAMQRWLGDDRVKRVPHSGHLVHIEAVPELTEAIALSQNGHRRHHKI